jgi:hypothetical protein
VIAAIEKLMEPETAGDPMTGLKWTRRTTQKIASELEGLGVVVSRNTVGRLLKDMDYSLRVNHKKIAGRSGLSSRDRNAQFEFIARQRQLFARTGLPIVSVDTKKKELVGNFKNPGTAWNRQPVRVNDHDFRSDAKGMAIPYGVYDLQANRGALFIGTSHDTPAFAVDCLEMWWRLQGRKQYPRAHHLLILADGGGSNGTTCRAWKLGLQQKLCDRHRLTISVSHYPSRASKWNPIEHRLFSEISKNWAGRPLDSYETILKYARTTTTVKGLRVRAYLVRRHYPKGVKPTEDEMRQLRIMSYGPLSLSNYTLTPRRNGK